MNDNLQPGKYATSIQEDWQFPFCQKPVISIPRKKETKIKQNPQSGIFAMWKHAHVVSCDWMYPPACFPAIHDVWINATSFLFMTEWWSVVYRYHICLATSWWTFLCKCLHRHVLSALLSVNPELLSCMAVLLSIVKNHQNIYPHNFVISAATWEHTDFSTFSPALIIVWLFT